VGNPTDGYGGSVISCSLRERATVTFEPAERLTVRIGDKSIELRERQDFRLNGDRFDCVRAVLTYMRLYDERINIQIDTEIPIRAGMAGSTAILSSLIAGLRRYLSIPDVAPHMLAEIVRTVELNFLEIQCGYQDQYMTVFGGLNYMDFQGKELYRDLPQEIFATIENIGPYVPELPFVLVHTGKDRISGHVLRPIRERWEEGDQDVLQGYRRIAQLARLAKRALIEANWPQVARLMTENHQIQQRLGASGEINDHYIRLSLEHGAMAAKLAGAGGGGTIICLTTDARALADALLEAGAARILSLGACSEGVRVEALD
jgi:galactokinase/mevalonate kinase-like predicted kinase